MTPGTRVRVKKLFAYWPAGVEGTVVDPAPLPLPAGFEIAVWLDGQLAATHFMAFTERELEEIQ